MQIPADRTFPVGSAHLDDSAFPGRLSESVIRLRQGSGRCHLNRYFKMLFTKAKEIDECQFYCCFVSER